MILCHAPIPLDASISPGFRLASRSDGRTSDRLILQAVINQGDVWLRHEQTAGTVVKTLVSPLVTFSVALISAAGVWVEQQRRSSAESETSKP